MSEYLDVTKIVRCHKDVWLGTPTDLPVISHCTAETNQIKFGEDNAESSTRGAILNVERPTSGYVTHNLKNMGTTDEILSSEGTQTVNGNKTVAGTLNMSSLTASLPLQLDASKNVTSGALSIAGDVSGTTSVTVVDYVGGQSSANIASTVTTVANATSTATASTIVRRDASNTFAGTLTGSASLNVLKAGDTMTGTLTITGGDMSVDDSHAITAKYITTDLNKITNLI